MKFVKKHVFLKVEADSGVHGGQLSHEYHLISNLEEDFVEICETCGLMSKGENSCEKCGTMKIKRSTVEVGHTFHLGTKYSKVFGANFAGKPLDMCCFGIGVSRLLPALVDNLTISKEAIRLPSAICPFDAVIIVKKSLASNVLVEMTISSIKRYLKGGILLDDRIEMSPGKRIHEANRLGATFIIVLANETERSLSINEPVIEIFTTKPKSCEVLSHESMSLKKLVTFVQSKSGQSHQTNQILTEMSSNQRAQTN